MLMGGKKKPDSLIRKVEEEEDTIQAFQGLLKSVPVVKRMSAYTLTENLCSSVNNTQFAATQYKRNYICKENYLFGFTLLRPFRGSCSFSVTTPWLCSPYLTSPHKALLITHYIVAYLFKTRTVE
jgi:hypothetical protein